MGSVKASILKLVKDTRLAAVAFPMIVYTSFQAQADELARFLYGHGLECASYHAGKSMQVWSHRESSNLVSRIFVVSDFSGTGPWVVQDREATQTSFTKGHLKVIVATVAFGMGMNIANVRKVVHMSMPRSLEEYVQQVRHLLSFPSGPQLPQVLGPVIRKWTSEGALMVPVMPGDEG
jgi:superfamily II DNA helicase RecQ